MNERSSKTTQLIDCSEQIGANVGLLERETGASFCKNSARSCRDIYRRSCELKQDSTFISEVTNVEFIAEEINLLVSEEPSGGSTEMRLLRRFLF